MSPAGAAAALFLIAGVLVNVPAQGSQGQLYDVGGYRLYLQCSGSGSPTVLLDAGLGADHTEWSAVEPRVAKFTRVCSWDRAGVGRSDRRPAAGPVLTEKIVSELHLLLNSAKVEPPYVLVGHSIGGIDVRLYQEQYSSEVAGLVLIDATPEQQELDGSATESANGEVMDVGSASRTLERWALPATLPLVVVERGQSTDSVWQAEQAALSTRSPDSALIVATDSDHAVQAEQPGLVAAAVEMDVRAIRASRVLAPCTTEVTKQSGTCLPAGTAVPVAGLYVTVPMLVAAAIVVLVVGVIVGGFGSLMLLRRRSALSDR